MRNICIVALLFLGISLTATAANKQKLRVACVGNSVTYGYKLQDRENTCYPHQLQLMLGESFDVRNFGHSGATLLNHGYRPYTQQQAYKDALDFKADVVIIHLGLNDTDPRAWPEYQDEFLSDYRALIQSFRDVNPSCRIWVCLMTPIFHDHSRFDSGTLIWHDQIQQRIRQLATTTPGIGLIDLYTPLHQFPNLFPDALHPNPEGAKILARTVFESLTGQFGFSLPDVYSSHMVLQRQQPVHFEGKANGNQRVLVELSNSQNTVIASCEATASTVNGHWEVDLPAMEAGGPYTLTFTTSGKKKEVQRKSFSDVWVGEVWLCSGQSNMEFQLHRDADYNQAISRVSDNANIHLMNMHENWFTNDYSWSVSACDSVDRLQYFDASQGWVRADSASVAQFSAVGYYFGEQLRQNLASGMHIGLILNAVGGSAAESWIDRTTVEHEFSQLLRNWNNNDFIQGWVRGRAQSNVKDAPLDSLSALTNGGRSFMPAYRRHPYHTSYLFEAGIVPLAHYSIKGAIWYQGESNAHNVEAHERIFPLLIKSWRNYFRQESMPFIFTQLSGIQRRTWPQFRDSQRRMADEMPNVWMAVSHDFGDSLDVHPRHKFPVGQRLALQALHHVYGEHVVSDAPVQQLSFRLNDSTVVVRFDQEIKTLDGHSPRCFELCGADGEWHMVEGYISGSDVILSVELQNRPLWVRYAWQPFTRANLCGATDIPVSTFRSKVE